MRSRATSPLGTPTTTESSGSPVSNPRFLEFWGLLGTGLAMLPTESSSHPKENIFIICIQRERKKDPRRIDPAAPSSRSLRAAGVGVQAASRRSDDVAVLRQHHPRTPPLEKISRGGEAEDQARTRRRRWRKAVHMEMRRRSCLRSERTRVSRCRSEAASAIIGDHRGWRRQPNGLGAVRTLWRRRCCGIPRREVSSSDSAATCCEARSHLLIDEPRPPPHGRLASGLAVAVGVR